MRALKRIPVLLLPVLLCLWPAPAPAHVGSPDVFHEGVAGPYRLFVTVRPPTVVPGVADVQVHSEAGDISRLRMVPLPLSGPGARLAPVPDVASRLAEDPQTFTGHLWIMTAGSWQVRILAEGARGQGELAVPVPALPQRTSGMHVALGVLLGVLLLALGMGLVSIAGVAAGEAQLWPGELPDAAARRRGRLARGATAALLLLGIWGGARWWRLEADRYAEYVYKPLQLAAAVQDGQLRLTMSDPGWQRRRVDDLLPDHDHLMHLFMVRMPGMEQIWHLHPGQTGLGTFVSAVPALGAGSYRLYADIVHESGVPETLVGTLELPATVPGRPLAGDDATAAGAPLPGSAAAVAPLQGGAQMVWLREPGSLVARAPRWFRFRVEDVPGHPSEDLELYMGMLGHAAFIRHDGSVFAHVHPSGSVPMAALALTQPEVHAGHHQISHRRSASMGPRLFDGEGGQLRLLAVVARSASMGPRLFDGEGDRTQGGLRRPRAASMGPRLFDGEGVLHVDGCAEAARGFNGAPSLRRGRGWSESCPTRR